MLLAMQIEQAGAGYKTSRIVKEGPFPSTTLFTNVPGHPTSNVPGHPGVHFWALLEQPFTHVYGSPNGNWMFLAFTDVSPFGTDVIMVNGEAKIFDEEPAPWTDGSENVETMFRKLGINNNGSWIFSVKTDAPPTENAYIVQVSPTDVYTYTAKVGEQVPQIPGSTWGMTLMSPVIANNGAVGWSGDGIGGLPITEDEILVFDGALLSQEGVTAPTGQIGTEFWQNFNEFYVSYSGNHRFVLGELTGDDQTDEVAVLDGMVVVQEGTILPNSSYFEPVEDIFEIFMDTAGNWFVHGYNAATGHDWIYRNGVVIAERGAPIYEGAAEVYSDTTFDVTFNFYASDSFGNYIIGGATDNPNLDANVVLVVNHEAVVIREGDPIDLDNNGIIDDDAYFDQLGQEDAFLDDYGNLYIEATMVNGSGNHIGQGIFKFDLSSILPEPIVYLPFTAGPG